MAFIPLIKVENTYELYDSHLPTLHFLSSPLPPKNALENHQRRIFLRLQHNQMMLFTAFWEKKMLKGFELYCVCSVISIRSSFSSSNVISGYFYDQLKILPVKFIKLLRTLGKCVDFFFRIFILRFF